VSRASIYLAGHRPLRSSRASKGFDLQTYTVIAYLLSLAFEGPVRSLLSLAHAESLLYLRDLFALIFVLKTCFGWRKQNEAVEKINVVAIAAYAMVCHAVLGWWIGHPVPAILFSAKIFLALLFGLASGRLLRGNERLFHALMVVFFLGSVAGVFLNAVVGDFPWEGAEYETAFGTVKNTRIWWAGGERRLAGFARASYNAAAVIGMAGAFLLAYQRRLIVKLLLAGIGGAAIYLTTMKGVFLSYAIIAVWAIFFKGERLARTGLWLAVLFAIISLVSPVVSFAFSISPDTVRFAPSNLGSFVERVAITWPDAMSGLDVWWKWFTGLGFGGVASALKFSPAARVVNPIDNMSLYFYANFGLIGIAYYCYLIKRIAELGEPGGGRYSVGLLGLGLLVISYGITSQNIEDPMISILTGLIVACGFSGLADAGEKGLS
jgi:hypothetical protein